VGKRRSVELDSPTGKFDDIKPKERAN